MDGGYVKVLLVGRKVEGEAVLPSDVVVGVFLVVHEVGLWCCSKYL